MAQLPGHDHGSIVEGFRLPASADLSQYSQFNTNTLWMDVAAIGQTYPLDWFAVRKTIDWLDGRKTDVIQFEQLIGQITEFVPSDFVEVPREQRFIPIKTQEDFSTYRPQLILRLQQLGLVAGK